MKRIIYLFLYLSFTTAQAQWNITLPNGESLNLQWQERENSQQYKGIHTFVGYSQNQFVATLVVHPNKEASGSLQWEGITYQLKIFIISHNNSLHFLIRETPKSITYYIF